MRDAHTSGSLRRDMRGGDLFGASGVHDERLSAWVRGVHADMSGQSGVVFRGVFLRSWRPDRGERLRDPIGDLCADVAAEMFSV